MRLLNNLDLRAYYHTKINEPAASHSQSKSQNSGVAEPKSAVRVIVERLNLEFFMPPMSTFWPIWPNLAPEKLEQPILPIIFSTTINEANSSAPDTERRILAQDSYGRQIGRLMDVVALLVEREVQSDPALSKERCITDLMELKGRIDHEKQEARRTRQERLVEDLLDLRRKDAAQFRAVLAAVNLP